MASYLFDVSIVIPVYNMEQYLDRCMESVLAQTLSNIEIILVDDGSSDRSAAMCDSYAKKYPQKVVVLHKENGGLSDARNTGMDQASGKYFMFVDSDDWIDDDCLVKIYPII